MSGRLEQPQKLLKVPNFFFFFFSPSPSDSSENADRVKEASPLTDVRDEVRGKREAPSLQLGQREVGRGVYGSPRAKDQAWRVRRLDTIHVRHSES